MKTFPKLLMLPVLAALPLAILLTGCGTGVQTVSTSVTNSSAMSGTVFGGQSPINGAVIDVYAADGGCEPNTSCTGTYGSAATLLGSSTTNANGAFLFPAGSLICPQSNTPVYILSVGGDTGSGTNQYAVMGTGLGQCSIAINSTAKINEVSTTALAFSLAQFFTTTLGGTPGTGDFFGGPTVASGYNVTYSQGLTRSNTYTIPLLTTVAIGGVPNQPVVTGSTTSTVESAKIYTIANILAACVNTPQVGSGASATPSSTCASLFSDTTPPGASPTAPSDTLQAAVQMALYPFQNVSTLFNMIPPTAVFSGSLLTAPNDFTIGVSYSTPAMGLSVLPQSVSTLDIDPNGKIWFPSNATGEIGVGDFDPTVGTFSGPYTNAALVHPQQVAVDASDTVWTNDSSSSNVAGFDTSSGANTFTFSIPNTDSQAVSIGDDNSVNVGIANNSNGNYYIANIPYTSPGTPSRSTYASVSSSLGNPIASIGADAEGGVSVITTTTAPRANGGYVAPSPTYKLTKAIVVTTNATSGQVIFTCPAGGCGASNGNFIFPRSYYGSNTYDGLCFFASGSCTTFTGNQKNSPEGMVIDGGANLWMAASADSAVEVAPYSDSYLTANPITDEQYLHGSGNGGTMTTPYGIGIDVSGNVWVSNAGCVGTVSVPTCTPGSFVLSELVGAATPTITSTVYQIITNTTYTSTRPTY